MLSGLLRLIFSIAGFAVQLAGWVMIAYVVMMLVIPQNKYTLLIGKYAQPVLAPVRRWLDKALPGVKGIDLSPVVVWLGLEIAGWILNWIRDLLG